MGSEDEAMVDKRDYYEVLGVEKSATQSDLKNAFRRLQGSTIPTEALNPTPRTDSRRFRKPMPSFQTIRSGLNTIDSVMKVRKAVRLVDLVEDSTSTSKISWVVISFPRSLVEVRIDDAHDEVLTFSCVIPLTLLTC